MITFTEGDMFETPADIRVNTVNCVGVMGTGVALAFKTKYPGMFRDYKKACKAGEVRPGQLHVWKNLSGDWIINFPTKRHWRDKSRYEDIEAGLIKLREYLVQQGKVRVTLPALGCGHGGLDWTRVSQMIRNHLSGLEADIIVFNPLNSREVGQRAKEDREQKLLDKDIAILHPDDNDFPQTLLGTDIKKLYVKGSPSLLDCPILAILPSVKPSETEISQATEWIEAMARPGLTIITGYDPRIGRPILRAGLSKGANVAICLSEGINRFRVREDVTSVWDESCTIVLSIARPRMRWNYAIASQTRELRFYLANAVLITDPSPHWLASYLRESRPESLPGIFYLTEQIIDHKIKSSLTQAGAQPLLRDPGSGLPDLSPITEYLKVVVGSVAEPQLRVPGSESEAEADAGLMQMTDTEVRETREDATSPGG
jgi:O-acetyl-ADP-ribose deacetylase (regulator of RNase III)